MIVELGSGPKERARGDMRIDCMAELAPDIVCLLGFEPIPLEDNTADKVYCYDFLEHIPKIAPYRENGKWKVHYPVIFLMNEVWRILKPGGIFESHTPCINPYADQDPTHVSRWNENSFLYFTGYYAETIWYGFKGKFEMVDQFKDLYLHTFVKALK